MIEETFEQFLGRMHMGEEPMILDDDLPDAYEAWLSETDVDLLIAYAGKWNAEQILLTIDKLSK